MNVCCMQGWEIDLKQHEATGSFMGNLSHELYDDRSDPTSIFYENYKSEVMFHITPKLPYESTAKQQQVCIVLYACINFCMNILCMCVICIYIYMCVRVYVPAS